jgi:hypothetical protein
MSETKHPLGGYEERLLGELRALVDERAAGNSAVRPGIHERNGGAGRLGRRSWPALGGVAAAATAATGLIVFAGGDGAEAAYAVEPHADGSITVEIRELRDAQGLENKLRAAGVPAEVDYLPAGMACREPRFRQAGQGALSGGLGQRGDGSAFFTLERNNLRAGQTLVITTSTAPGAEGAQPAFSIGMAVAEGPVAPCDPVAAPPERSSAPPGGQSVTGGQSATGGRGSVGVERGVESGGK